MCQFAGLKLHRLLNESTILKFSISLRHFGMKIHIGANDTPVLIHSIETTAANVHDIVLSGNLLHAEKRPEHKQRKNVSWFITRRPSARKELDEDKPKAEKMKASICSKMEHPFRYIKQVFGYSKVRYRAWRKTLVDCTCWPRLAIF